MIGGVCAGEVAAQQLLAFVAAGVSSGEPMPLQQARQWIGSDCSGYDLYALAELVEETQRPVDFPIDPTAGGLPDYLQSAPTLFDSSGYLMEYIGQFGSAGSFTGFGYIFHSTVTGETAAELQTT